MKTQQVLIIAAHPDDEVLGCGGTIARHCKQGDNVTVLIMADGVNSRSVDSQAQNIDERKICAHQANSILGVSDLILLSYPDNKMDTVPLLDVVKDIEKVIDKIHPEIIYTHNACDVNIDHRIVNDAVVTACRALPEQSVKQLLFFEIPSSTEWRPPASGYVFQPNWFTDISDTLEIKLEALSAYSEELREFPHPRSLKAVEHLACWRGASTGLIAAEAFELARMIS